MRLLKLPLTLLFVLAPRLALAEDDPLPAPIAQQEPQGPQTAPPAAEPPPAAAGTNPPPPSEPVPEVKMENLAGQQAIAPVEPTPPGPAPGAPSGGTGLAPSPGGGPPAPSSGEWKFEFHGYFRAPFRVGVGKRDFPRPGQSETTYHYPVIPDDQYLSWQHTTHNQKDWAELFFSYGNSFAKGTVGIQGFNFTDAAWAEPDAQFGISQGFVTLTPEMPWENVRFWWKVGSFWNKYGTAGKYDAGYYDTFLFGRTHAMGETARIEMDVPDTGVTLGLEHGIGGKRPDPSIYNRAKFTLLHHIHGDVSYQKIVTVGVHSLSAIAQEEDRVGTQANTQFQNLPDGKMGVYGADLRVDANMFGYFYVGASRIVADHAVTVAPAIEVLHSFGGGQYTLGVTDNYLDSSGCSTRNSCSGGNGAVNSILGQYEFSFANLFSNLEKPGERFWGEGRDVTIALYGMYNAIQSADPVQNGVKKLKYGTDLAFHALPWLGAALKYDRLQPNSDFHDQSFSILSPRIFFKSNWVSHEEIVIQYSRYIYDQRVCPGFIANPTDPGYPGVTPADGANGTPVYQVGEEHCVQPPRAPTPPEGFGGTSVNNERGAATYRPDVNVFKIQASMWW